MKFAVCTDPGTANFVIYPLTVIAGHSDQCSPHGKGACDEVEAIQVWWHGREYEAALVEVGLHHGDGSSSMQGKIQTWRDTGYK